MMKLDEGRVGGEGAPVKGSFTFCRREAKVPVTVFRLQPSNMRFISFCNIPRIVVRALMGCRFRFVHPQTWISPPIAMLQTPVCAVRKHLLNERRIPHF
jgi:hypothetical protein